MNSSEFIKEILKRSTKAYSLVHQRVKDPRITNLLHAAMGMDTESGEFMDAIKKHLFYGKTVDEVNLKEELGDMLWYIGLACHSLGVTIEELMDQNTKKLTARYGESFSEDKANNRDLTNERKILENII
jgi:NTP pyrophosphatase (non-canonical NTP hydrolase)